MPVKPENAIRAKLGGLFMQVEPQFRADTIERYKATAEGQFDAWVKLLAGEEPPRDRWYHDTTRCPQYVGHTGGSYSPTWSMLVAAQSRNEWYCNFKRAEKDANDSVDYAKEHFITKQTKKITNATKLRTDRPTISGTLRYRVLIEGTLTFTYPNGDRFNVVMSMIVNHRYERGYTSFYQFPARFTDVHLDGKPTTARMSEKWMSENFKCAQ